MSTLIYFVSTGFFSLDNGHILINACWLFLFFGIVCPLFFTPDIAPLGMVAIERRTDDTIIMRGYAVHVFLLSIVSIIPVATYPLLFVPNISASWQTRLLMVDIAEIPIVFLLFVAALKGKLRIPTLTVSEMGISHDASVLREVRREDIKLISVRSSIISPRVTIETFPDRYNPLSDPRVFSAFLPIGTMRLASSVSEILDVPLVAEPAHRSPG